MKVLIVENRSNEAIMACLESAKKNSIDAYKISHTDGGEDYSNFTKNYIHLSTNSLEFELICFRRYFILKQYAKKNGIKKFFLCDSDVIFFSHAAKLIDSFSENDYFVGSYIEGSLESYEQISPHFSFWTIDALESFTDFLVNSYKSNEFILKIKKIREKFDVAGRFGGVSDMTLLKLWSDQHNFRKSLSMETKFGVVDHNFAIASNYKVDEYKKSFGFKRIILDGDAGYFVRSDDNRRVPVAAAHFQGRCKLIMPHVLRCSRWKIIVLSLAVYAARKIRILTRKIGVK